jgi:2-dehydropantoate 2-reductase
MTQRAAADDSRPLLRIAVVGGGAMGSIYAGMLGAAGHAVWLVDVWREHIEQIRSHGLTIDRASGTDVIQVNATTSADDVGEVELAILAVKAFDTEQAADTIQCVLRPGGVAISMQNGIGGGERLARKVPHARVAVGVPGLGGSLIAPGHVVQRVSAPSHLGWLDGPATADLVSIARSFTAAGFDTETVDDVVALQWRHVAVVAGVNAIAALCRVPNIEVVRVPEAAHLSELAILEVVAVTTALGVRLDWDDPVAACREVYRGNGEDHLSSMTLDVLRERTTEIGVLNGAVVAAGQHLGIPTPVNEALYLAIRTIEATAGRRAHA